jgi:hypothetical protein
MGRPAQDFVLPDLVVPDLVLPDLALGDHAYREEIRAIDYALQALETLQRVELRSPAEAIEQPGTRSAGIAS